MRVAGSLVARARMHVQRMRARAEASTVSAAEDEHILCAPSLSALAACPSTRSTTTKSTNSSSRGTTGAARAGGVT